MTASVEISPNFPSIAADTSEIARLARLAISVEPLGEDGQWLARGIEMLLSGAETSLDAALGFRQRGGITLATEIRQRRRNALLIEFARRFLPDLSRSNAAKALEVEIYQFETRVWPRLAARADCPPHLCETRHGLLFEIFKLGPVPGSHKQFCRILAGHPSAV